MKGDAKTKTTGKTTVSQTFKKSTTGRPPR